MRLLARPSTLCIRWSPLWAVGRTISHVPKSKGRSVEPHAPPDGPAAGPSHPSACHGDYGNAPRRLIGVFWDSENILPPRRNEVEVMRALRRAIGPGEISFIKAYEDATHLPMRRGNWTDCGVRFHVFEREGRKEVADMLLVNDALAFAHDYPGSTIVVLSDDSDFAYALNSLRNRGHEVVLFQSRQGFQAANVRAAASEFHRWGEILTEAKACPEMLSKKTLHDQQRQRVSAALSGGEGRYLSPGISRRRTLDAEWQKWKILQLVAEADEYHVVPRVYTQRDVIEHDCKVRERGLNISDTPLTSEQVRWRLKLIQIVLVWLPRYDWDRLQSQFSIFAQLGFVVLQAQKHYPGTAWFHVDDVRAVLEIVFEISPRRRSILLRRTMSRHGFEHRLEERASGRLALLRLTDFCRAKAEACRIHPSESARQALQQKKKDLDDVERRVRRVEAERQMEEEYMANLGRQEEVRRQAKEETVEARWARRAEARRLKRERAAAATAGATLKVDSVKKAK